MPDRLQHGSSTSEPNPGPQAAGSSQHALTYQERLEQEIAHYRRVFRGRLFQDVPPAWLKAEGRFTSKVAAATGAADFVDYVVRHVAGSKCIDLLGLGSGGCGNELELIEPRLRAQGCETHLTCVDVNREVLDQAAAEAARRGVAFTPLIQDINEVSLGTDVYDVILALASLHHFIELDHILADVNRALKPNGLFLTIDVPTRNGFRMWPETKHVVDGLWAVLPAKFKFDHTGFETPTYAETFVDADYSVNCMECINSEAILPALEKNLRQIHFVPAFSLARRFLDTKFGPNYDLDQPLDAAVAEFLLNLDDHYLEKGLLRPETFFGTYTKK